MATPTHSVEVSGISPNTTQKGINDFFSFCGKITDVSYESGADTAIIHFEKPSAAKTALMLNGGTFDGATIAVTSESDPAAVDPTPGHHEGPPEQSDKPRAAIAAEYLAKGYGLSDQILQRAIEIDTKHGISTRFLTYFQTIDTKLGEKTLGREKTISGKIQETFNQATAAAQNVDKQQGISSTAHDYYTKALASPWGQKVLSFYTSTSKQVLDIHEEARRIAGENKNNSPTSATAPQPHDTPVSTATGTVNPPVDSAVQTITEPVAAGSAGGGINGGPDSKAEAPTVV